MQDIEVSRKALPQVAAPLATELAAAQDLRRGVERNEWVLSRCFLGDPT